jgi:glutathione S-transferase
MKLYGALISPFVRKVAVVLAEKGLDYERRRGGPGVTDAEFLSVSPFAKIPVIDDSGFILSDSTAIVCYLDAKYPEPSLIPQDAESYGRAIWLDEFADTIFAEAGLKILFNRLVGPKLLKTGGDEALALQGEAELPRSFDYIENQVPDTGWLLGDHFSIADIAVASVLRTLVYVGYGPDRAARPRTAAWYDRVTARPAWATIAAQEAVMASKMMLAA